MSAQQFKTVLIGKFIEFKNNLYYYQINGDSHWQGVFQNQKSSYVQRNSNGELIYSVPWYYGLECGISENDFNGKLFFNINELEKRASLIKDFKYDYWHMLAEQTKDKNWLSRSNYKGI